MRHRLQVHPAVSAGLLLLLLLVTTPANAQDPAPTAAGPVITSSAELTAVWASGNSDASTFGLRGNVRSQWTKSELKFEAGGLRTESTLTTRRAVGTTDDFNVEETTNRERTAENYFARARFDRKVSEAFLVFSGVDWLRNTFSGINSRFLVAAGAGNTVVDNESIRLKTDYGVTYTFQNDVVTNPFTNSNFPGVRAAYDFWYQVSSTTELTSTLVADLNLDNTDDIRLNFVAALPVAISSRLALKPSLQLLWQNEPSFTEVALFTAGTGDPAGKVLIPLQKLDSFFTLAIVVKL